VYSAQSYQINLNVAKSRAAMLQLRMLMAGWESADYYIFRYCFTAEVFGAQVLTALLFRGEKINLRLYILTRSVFYA
jgi:hypothetical protein